jgi:hypothetical protein
MQAHYVTEFSAAEWCGLTGILKLHEYAGFNPVQFV